jgi:hypothetical protein
MRLYEDFSKISRKVLISEIDDLLVDLTDLGFEWYFPYFVSQNKTIIISIMPKDGVENNVDFKVDDTMIDCMNTLSDWMKEKYGIGSVSYILSLCSGSDIKTKQFAEEEFGLALYEIRIVLNL